jgi:hypothetical protein
VAETCGRIFLRQNFHFLIRYSNMNILSSWYRNQVIQKLKFIYACKTTTFMRIQGEIKLFYTTDSGRNLVGKKNGLLIWFKNWRMPSSPIWLRV